MTRLRSGSRSCGRQPRIDRYLSNRAGDLKRLKPPETGFRLRCGDYRVFFDHGSATMLEITGVRHRREAYR